MRDTAPVDVARRLLLARAIAAADVHSHLVARVQDLEIYWEGAWLVPPFITNGESPKLLREVENLGVALRVWAGMSWSAIAEDRGYRGTRSNASPARRSATPSRQFVHRTYSAEVNRLLHHASRPGAIHELTSSNLAGIPDNRDYFAAEDRSRSGDRAVRADLIRRTERLAESLGVSVNPFEGIRGMQRDLETYLWGRLRAVRVQRSTLQSMSRLWTTLRERRDKWWLDSPSANDIPDRETIIAQLERMESPSTPLPRFPRGQT